MSDKILKILSSSIVGPTIVVHSAVFSADSRNDVQWFNFVFDLKKNLISSDGAWNPDYEPMKSYVLLQMKYNPGIAAGTATEQFTFDPVRSVNKKRNLLIVSGITILGLFAAYVYFGQ